MPFKDYIYLDYAAATPLDERVKAAMEPYLSENFYNPSALYSPSIEVKSRLNEARSLVANWLGSKSQEVIFTAGATEANNLAIHGIMANYPEASMVLSPIEHESVIGPAKTFNHRFVDVKADGRVDINDLVDKIDDQTVLVSIMHANNEIGVIEPLHDIAKLLESLRKKRKNNLPLYFHTDAAQSANYLDIHVNRLGVDLLSLNGGKLYGPKQTGVLYVGSHVNLSPLILGGGQERGLRSGTENVAGVIGLSEALNIAQLMKDDEDRRLKSLQDYFLNQLSANFQEALIINGSQKYRLPNNIHVTFIGQDNERLIYALNGAKILAATGSACSASNDEPSHVLKAIGLSDDLARQSIRFTLGRGTSEEELRIVIKILTPLIGK